MPECDLCGEPVADDWLLCMRCRRVGQRAPPREGGGQGE